MELFPFRFRDPLTGKWVRARYRASRAEITARHKEWEITGPPENRQALEPGRYFSPYRVAHPVPTNVEQVPCLAAGEQFLVLLFLRRYVTYCARRQWFARMQGAANLARAVASKPG